MKNSEHNFLGGEGFFMSSKLRQFALASISIAITQVAAAQVAAAQVTMTNVVPMQVPGQGFGRRGALGYPKESSGHQVPNVPSPYF